MENGHIVEQGDASCFTERKPKHLKTISLTKIRDNNNEKVLIAALIAGFSLSATAAETFVLPPKPPILRLNRLMQTTNRWF